MPDAIRFVYKTFHPIHSPCLYGEQYFLDTLLTGKVDFQWGGELAGLDGVIISFRGNDNAKYIDELNEAISHLKWCVIIITGNENSTGFYKLIKHHNCKVWVQTPKWEDDADYYLGFGLPTRPWEYERPQQPRFLDWSFAGQVNHSRREQLSKVLHKMPDCMPLVNLIETTGFFQGLPHRTYVDLLHNTKVVPCPGGPSTPDTFRLYEALECGCVPVADAHAGHHDFDGDYWQKVFGEVPFPVIHDWREFPELLKHVLADWDKLQPEVASWWADRKQKIVTDLFSQIKELQQ